MIKQLIYKRNWRIVFLYMEYLNFCSRIFVVKQKNNLKYLSNLVLLSIKHKSKHLSLYVEILAFKKRNWSFFDFLAFRSVFC
jgi:hypothetical protein